MYGDLQSILRELERFECLEDDEVLFTPAVPLLYHMPSACLFTSISQEDNK